MPNFIEDANILPTRFVSALSRYTNSTVVYYHIGNQKKIAFTTYKKIVNTKPSDNDTYTVVPPGMEFRPDLVSQSAYGTTDFWWKIMEANNIKDIYEFKAGTNLRLPGNVF